VAGHEWDKNFVQSRTLTGYSKSHLWKCYQLACEFAPDERNAKVPWGVHGILLREPDREKRRLLLERAELEDWTQRDALKYFADFPPTGKTYHAPAPTYRLQHVECPNCHHQFPAKGHRVKTTS
jgi:hypothetical protein